MSYTNTFRLLLAKADPGTNQPFQTEVFNQNWDKVDAEAVAVDGRLDVVEAKDVAQDGRLTSVEGRVTSVEGVNTVQSGRLDVVEAANWVTGVRIADGAVGSSELADGAVADVKLASSLDLSAKTVLVPTQTVFDNSSKVASTAHAYSAAYTLSQAAVSSNNSSKNLPVLIQAGVKSATTDGSGSVTLTFPTAFATVPVVTANLLAPAGGTSGTFVAVLQSVTASAAVFRVYNQAGSVVSATAVSVHWQAMAY
jgi:hypothetical protein